VGILPVIPAFGEGFKNFVKALAAFQVPIGIIAILLGFLGLVT
jgi:hypothetical protein